MDLTFLILTVAGVVAVITVAIDRALKYRHWVRITQYILCVQKAKNDRLIEKQLRKIDVYQQETESSALKLWDENAERRMTKAAIKMLKYAKKPKISMYLSRGDLASNFYISADRPVGNIVEEVVQPYRDVCDQYGIIEFAILFANKQIRILITIINGYEENIVINVPAKAA